MKKLISVLLILFVVGCAFVACEANNSSEENDQDIMHTHSYGEWSVTTAATCGAKGEEKRTCACGESETREIPTEGEHVYGVNNVCTKCQTPLAYTLKLEYVLNDDGNSYAVKVGNATNIGVITVPPYYQGKPVTTIADKAFFACKSLVLINIPATVTLIGTEAFSYCTSLTSIYIPSSVTFIGAKAFAGEIYAHMKLESITFAPNGKLSSIGKEAFYWCTSLTSIAIPEGTSVIEDGAFSYCQSLTSLTLPSSMISIGDSAFRDCRVLASLEIPPSVAFIGDKAFYDCRALKTVVFAEGCEVNIATSVFEGCGNLPRTQYNNCTYITANGDPYFLLYSCDDRNLDSYQVHENTKMIAGSAFSMCLYTTSFDIPEGVISIGNRALSGCSSLVSIHIPSAVSSIGEGVFSGCKKLESITVESGNKKYHAAGDCLIETKSSTLIAGCKSSVIPVDGSVTAIAAEAFHNILLTSIHIPTSVVSVGDRAFRGCISLTSIEIPASVTSIGALAFHNCASLASIKISAGVIFIGEHAFLDCSSLTSVMFAETRGWSAGETAISFAELSDPTTAARCLRRTYCHYYWVRTVE